jgi:hypothetical protein
MPANTAKVLPYKSFTVKFGDGATPTEAFTATCGFTSRSFKRNKNFNEIKLPDCTDEDLPAVIARAVESSDWGVSGEGVMTPEMFSLVEAMNISNTAKNVHIEFNFPAPLGLKTYSGKIHLSNVELAADYGGFVTAQVEFVADGALTLAP